MAQAWLKTVLAQGNHAGSRSPTSIVTGRPVLIVSLGTTPVAPLVGHLRGHGGPLRAHWQYCGQHHLRRQRSGHHCGYAVVLRRHRPLGYALASTAVTPSSTSTSSHGYALASTAVTPFPLLAARGAVLSSSSSSSFLLVLDVVPCGSILANGVVLVTMTYRWFRVSVEFLVLVLALNTA